MPRVNIRRRRGPGSRPSALTAAAQRVDSTDPASAFRKSLISSGGWQEEAEKYLELVGELAYYVSWRALSASRCRIVASAVDDNGEPLGSIPDDDPNADTVRRIVSDIGGGAAGQSKILQRGAYLLTVVGEYWVGMVVRDPSRETVNGTPVSPDSIRIGQPTEEWYVFNRSQIRQSGQDIDLQLPDGTTHTFDPDVDILFRTWDEHPLDPSQAVSPIWSNRVTLNEIVRATATIDNASKSRLVGNGILAMPQEMSLPSQVAPAAVPQGEPGTRDPEPEWEPNGGQELQDLLYDVATTAIKDPDSLAALLPIIVSASGEHIKNIQWLRPSSEVPETALKTREAAIRRLALGLDVTPERMLGLGSTTNHWSGWLIDETDVKVHISPLVELIVGAFTKEVLRGKLVEEGIDPDAYVAWYDTTSLTQDPDKSDEAVSAYDRGQLSGDALREHLGFDAEDGYDLSTADGWVQLALDKISSDPANAALFMPIIESAANRVGLEVGTLPEASPDATQPAPDPLPGPQTEPEPPQSEPEEPQVSAALMTVARMCVNRALELANKRRRTRSNHSAFRDIAITRAHTRLPSVEFDKAAELISGWDTALTDSEIIELGADPSGFRDTIRSAAVMALVSGTDPFIPASCLRRKHVPS